MMLSSFYKVDQELEATFAWYKPESLNGYSQAMREHIELGGLVIKKIEPPTGGDSDAD